MLDVLDRREDVTVTANPGGVTDLRTVSQPVNMISADDILARAKTVVAQAFEGETGVNLQRTSPGMAGVFVRGLTGNKVNVFVDGVRYSNGAQRGGVNTFLDLIDPVHARGHRSAARHVERAVRQRRARRQRAVPDERAGVLDRPAAGVRRARSRSAASRRTSAASATSRSDTRASISACSAAPR